MPLPQIPPVRGGLVLLLALAVPAVALADDKRLYRWVDPSGKVHYTDALPPEVVDQARQELSASTGLVRSELGRQLTAEERAAAEAAASSEAERRFRAENLRRADEAKVLSFRTEDDLRAAYVQRAGVIDETLASLRAAIDAQRGSLNQQLGVAGDSELAGRPVPEKVAETIDTLRRELLNQEQAMVLRAAEKQVLQEEVERLVLLFRERESRGLAQPQG